MALGEMGSGCENVFKLTQTKPLMDCVTNGLSEIETNLYAYDKSLRCSIVKALTMASVYMQFLMEFGN